MAGFEAEMAVLAGERSHQVVVVEGEPGPEDEVDLD